jgi:hypothetical protein
MNVEAGNIEMTLEDSRLVEHMTANWPRFFELINLLNYREVVHVQIIKKVDDTIKNKSIVVTLVSHGKESKGKTKSKKLLKSLTVN